MKIAVIVSDATHAVFAGGEVTRTIRQFDASDEMAAYIEKQVGDYVSVSLAIIEEQP